MTYEPVPRPLTLRDVLAIFRRQKLTILVILFLAMVAGVASIKLTKPMYRSFVDILVEGRTQNSGPGNVNDPVSEVTLPNQELDILTQIEVLQSETVLGEAFSSAGIDPPSQSLPKAEGDLLMPVVKVEQAGATNVLRINVDSLNPDIAERLVTVYPDVYMAYLTKTRQGEVENALSFLTQQLTQEEHALRQSENDLEVYKRTRSLLPLEAEGQQRSMKVTSAQTDVERAAAQMAGAQERLNALLRERTRLPKTLSSPNTQANSSSIESQKNLIAELKARRDSLLTAYLPDAPPVKEVDAEIASQEHRLAELPKVQDTSTKTLHPETIALDERITDAKAGLRDAEAQYRKLEAAAAKSESALKQFNALQPKQDVLERSVQDHKDSIAAIRRGLEDLSVRRNSARDPITKLSRPVQPEKVRPRNALYLAIAFLVGSSLAFGIAIVKDGLEDRVTSADEIYSLTGLPALGAIPSTPKRKRLEPGKALDNLTLEKYRGVRFNLMFATLEKPVRSIVITSSGGQEGKTEFACNLATAASGEGRRVILVDANLRNPTIHKKMNVDGKPGLTDVAIGVATLEDSLHATAIPGLRVLTCGQKIDSPAEFLASPQMRSVYAQLLASADLIIFDSPCSLESADAQILSNSADSVLYVAKAGASKRSSVYRGIQALQKANARVLGVVLSGAAKD